MNLFKTLAMVGLVGVGMVYGQTPETQYFLFPTDTKNSSQSLQDLLKQSAVFPATAISTDLNKEQTQSLLQFLKNYSRERTWITVHQEGLVNLHNTDKGLYIDSSKAGVNIQK